MAKNSSAQNRSNDQRAHRMLNVATVLLLLSFLLFVAMLLNFASFEVSAANSNDLPLSIRATSQADYSADRLSSPIPPISLNILNQIITDVPATGDPNLRMTSLAVSLLSPVPTMTLNPTFQVSATPATSIVSTQVGESPTPFTTDIPIATATVSGSQSPSTPVPAPTSAPPPQPQPTANSHPTKKPHPTQARNEK